MIGPGRVGRRRRAVFLAAAASLLSCFLGAPQAVAGQCGWRCHVGPGAHPDPDSYVGSLLLPPDTSSADSGLVGEAAHCPGCMWRLSPACRTNTPDPELDCLNAAASCPPPALLTALWLRRPPEIAMRRVGLFCRRPDQPLTPEQYVPGVRDQFIKLLPVLDVTYQPVGRGIVNLPTLFATNQPMDLGHPTFTLGGHPIGLTATASWHLDFGDGRVGDFARPGGAYPDQDIAHPYRGPGTYRVTVTTSWVGEFTVDGLGPFPVTGPDVVQREVVVVPVKQARAVLVP